MIYFDYMGIRAWALGEWKRNKKGTIAYYDYMQSVKDKIAINFVKLRDIQVLKVMRKPTGWLRKL